MSSNCEKYGFFEITEHKESEHSRLGFIESIFNQLAILNHSLGLLALALEMFTLQNSTQHLRTTRPPLKGK